MKQLNPKIILIIATRQIGDTLITSPLIIKTHETWPNAKIHFLVFNEQLSILKGHPYIDEWIGVSKRPNYFEYLALLKRLFRRYDLALVTQPSDRAHLFGLFSAKVRFGVIDGSCITSWWKRLFCRHTVQVDYFNQHVVIEKLKLIPDKFKITSSVVKVIPPTLEELPHSFDLEKPYIVIHSTPLGRYKRILNTTWINVINQLVLDYDIYLTGSNASSDKDLTQSIVMGVHSKYCHRIHDVAGMLNFSQVAKLLSYAKLYIGVDTSISHLAAACDTKSLVLFGPTPPTNYGPWPNGFSLEHPYKMKGFKQKQGYITILQGPGDCVPCRKAGCNDNINSISECLHKLTADEILKASYDLLDRKTHIVF